MSEHINIVLIKDMMFFIDKIENYNLNISHEAFITDRKTVDATLLCIMQIGELANKLSEDFKDKHDGIDWFNVRGLRNRITHDYKNINVELIWDVVTINIPELKKYIEKII
ncbi:MAG: HepT-like ribonuclease domain-containing protein [Bacteroidota bacterium]